MPRVAVIDDDCEFLDLVSDVLSDRGYDVELCFDAVHALSCVKQAHPDVVLVDVRLQSLKNGWEIIEELRQDEQTRLIPIVLCSAAMDELSQREGWLRERGIATLPKPFDIDDLYAAVERQLSG